MNKKNILEKLKVFLQTRAVFEEECEVVYFLIEIRKLIEDNIKSYKTLYFYCCWVAHSELSYPSVANFLSAKFDGFIDFKNNKIEIQRDLINGQEDFFKLRDLNDELREFLNAKNLPTNFLNGNAWHKFCQLFLDNIVECEIDISNVKKKPHKINKLIAKKDKNKRQYFYGFHLANGVRIPRIILKYKIKISNRGDKF